MNSVELKDNLALFSSTVSDEVRAVRTLLNGNKLTLALLKTVSKEDLVSAINEVFLRAEQGVSLEAIDIAVNDYFVLHPQSFTYYQGEAVNSILITHPLDHAPAVKFTDSAGTEWTGQVTHPAPNQVLIQFNFPLSGTATLY